MSSVLALACIYLCMLQTQVFSSCMATTEYDYHVSSGLVLTSNFFVCVIQTREGCAGAFPEGVRLDGLTRGRVFRGTCKVGYWEGCLSINTQHKRLSSGQDLFAMV